MKRRTWLVLGTALVGLATFLVFNATRSAPLETVETEVAGSHPIKASILASGNLVYAEAAQLSPEVIAKVVEILKKEGDHVERGEVVLRLDDQSSRAQVAQQEAAVQQQRSAIERQELGLESQLSQYRRKQGLRERKMLADQQLEDARYAVELARVDVRTSRANLKQAEALLNQYREVLAKTTIRAPISGTVIAVDIKVGETAVASQGGAAGSSLMTIANTATIMSEVNVDEADIARIKLGQEVLMLTAAFPDTPLKGVVQTIPLSFKRQEGGQNGGGTQARSYSVKVRLPDVSALALRSGMSCRAEIFVSNSGSALAVPVQAVLTDNGDAAQAEGAADQKKAPAKAERHVFVFKDGRAQKRSVTVGMADDSRQEVLGGLKAGEQIITGPYMVLRQIAPDQAVTAAKPQP